MPFRIDDSDHVDIRRLPLFADISDEQYARLTHAGYVQNFPPGVEVITEGDPSDFLHIVIDGSVELFSTWNGRETTMATARPVTTFILAATVRDAPYLMSARTAEKSRLVLLPSSNVREIFDADAAFARAVVSELADRFRAVIKNTKSLKLRSSIERLANYLLRQRTRLGTDSFDLTMEKRRLASYLGMTPENLSRSFKTLQAYGVTTDGSLVTIGDPADLEGLAKPSPLIDDPAI